MMKTPLDTRYARGLMVCSSLLIAAIACRPVVAIGYQELAILILIAVVLLGPLLFRIYRVVQRIRDEKDKGD
jgi:hypothetical protein